MGHRTVHRPDAPNREGKRGLDDQPRAHLDMREVPLGDRAAFSQMREWGHAGKYQDHGQAVHRVAAAGGRGARNLVEVRAEKPKRSGDGIA